jgi:hypothetical protein
VRYEITDQEFRIEELMRLFETRGAAVADQANPWALAYLLPMLTAARSLAYKMGASLL